jgi:ABC-type antimicrobial peptide transport system permease subunit
MTLAAIGLLVGLPLALGMARAVAGLLYGVAPDDFATFAGVAGILVGVALVACYIPARRAMRVDPMVALRCE